MRLLRGVFLLTAMLCSFVMTAQQSNHFYVHISAKPGLTYGLTGIQYERNIYANSVFQVDAYAGLKTIWGGHFYRGLAYPSLPFGTNLIFGREKKFLEIGGGIAYFWELGYKPEAHIAYKSVFYNKYFLKFSLNLDYIKTTDVFPIDDLHRTFKYMERDFSVGVSLGQRLF